MRRWLAPRARDKGTRRKAGISKGSQGILGNRARQSKARIALHCKDLHLFLSFTFPPPGRCFRGHGLLLHQSIHDAALFFYEGVGRISRFLLCLIMQGHNSAGRLKLSTAPRHALARSNGCQSRHSRAATTRHSRMPRLRLEAPTIGTHTMHLPKGPSK